MACGAGHWRTALLASGFTLMVLVLGHRIEQILAAPLNGRHADHREQPHRNGSASRLTTETGAR
jgi:uncharacterized membrane protein YhiD involved in acid resistance